MTHFVRVACLVGSAEELARVRRVVEEVRARIGRFHPGGLGEQNTKATLIEPILEVLAWDIRDPEQVHREFKPTPRDSPVDYALAVGGAPRLFVEAKRLGGTLQDRRWVAQVLGYATVAGVKWCVLTDGDEYRLYSAAAALDAEAKLFQTFRLTTGDPQELAKLLWMISRSSLEENRLDHLWSRHFVEREVRSVLGNLLSQGDRRLLRLLRQELPDHSPSQLAAATRRLRLASPETHDEPPASLAGETARPAGEGRVRRRRDAAPAAAATPARPTGRRSAVAPRRRVAHPERPATRTDIDCSLTDLLQAGVLTAPLRLFHNGYQGRDFEATLNADGSITFAGTRFKSPSAAGSAARQVVMRRPMQTNGWAFWWVVLPDGREVTLEQVRQEYTTRGR